MASGNNVPRDLKWVEALAACSAKQVFEELRLGVEDDIKATNVTRQLEEAIGFRLAGNTAGNVFIVCGAVTAKTVTFLLGNSHVAISKQLGEEVIEKMTVTLTLNNEGRCKLKIDGEELEQWQVRRKALEDLFFGVD